MGININDLNNRLNLVSAASLSDRENVLDNLRELSEQELQISGGSDGSSSSVTNSDSESFTISIPDFDSSLDSIPLPSLTSLSAPVPPSRGFYYSYLDDIDININVSSSSSSNSTSSSSSNPNLHH